MQKEYLAGLEQEYTNWIQLFGLSPYRTVDKAHAWCREQARIYGPYVSESGTEVEAFEAQIALTHSQLYKLHDGNLPEILEEIEKTGNNAS